MWTALQRTRDVQYQNVERQNGDLGYYTEEVGKEKYFDNSQTAFSKGYYCKAKQATTSARDFTA